MQLQETVMDNAIVSSLKVEKDKIYSIEFLRIFFVFFIIVGHVMQVYPEIKDKIYSFLHSTMVPTWFCVEYYSIIGGFLIYRNFRQEGSLFDKIKHIYARLAPTVLFLYFIAFLSGIVSIKFLVTVLTMTQGMSIPIADAIGWGDWFVGAYFWAACICLSLLYYFKDKAFLYTLPLMYICLVMLYHTGYPGWMKAYHNIIGTEFLRVLQCMGLGLVCGFLSKNLYFSKKKLAILVFSFLECVSIFYCFRKIFHGNSVDYLMALLWCGVFLILSSHCAGYLSALLNKIRRVTFFSKYCWNVFIGHAYILTLLKDKSNFGLGDTTCACIVLVGAIIVGILEYHLIENRFVPWIIKYFKNGG